MAANSPKVARTLQAMAEVANDPAIEAMLRNTQDATFHGAQVVETVDIATRGLPKKAGRVQWLIEKNVGLVKVTVPLCLKEKQHEPKRARGSEPAGIRKECL